jgi:AsmA protein
MVFIIRSARSGALKKILVALCLLAGLLVLAGIAAVLLIDVNTYKPRIENAVSDALGMEFRIRGKMGLRLFPPAGVVLSDVRLRNRGSDLATAGAVRVGVELLPLLRRQLVITNLALVDPIIRIEKGADGKFNFETPPRPAKPPEPGEKGKAAGSSFFVADGALKNGGFFYLDRATGGKTEISGMEVALKELSLPASPDVPRTKGIRFTGDLRAKELRTGDLSVSDVKAKVAASGGICDVRPFTMKLFGGTGEGGIRADLSMGEPVLRIDCTLTGFRAEESLAAVSKEKRLSGPLTLSPDLSLRGTDAGRMKRTLNGKVSLRGKGLTVHGMDIDGMLSTVSAAQQLNLADVGAFLLAGPLGTGATKGFQSGGPQRSAGRAKDTEVTMLVSDWTVRDGIAEARDVAFSTRRNRIALKGRLDLVNERFLDVTVAALDPKGCVRIRQKIGGPFRNPQVDKTSALESAVVGSFIDLLSPARKLVGGASECERFYAGSVPHPN